MRNHGCRTRLAFPAGAAAVGGDTTSETSSGRRRSLGSLVHGGFAGAKLDGGHLLSKKSTNQTCSTLHCHQAPSQGSFIIRRPISMTLKRFEPRSITCSKKSSSSILQHSEHYFFVIPALYQVIHREFSSGAAAPATPHELASRRRRILGKRGRAKNRPYVQHCVINRCFTNTNTNTTLGSRACPRPLGAADLAPCAGSLRRPAPGPPG